MNARVELPEVESAYALAPDHIRLALKRLLASPVFSKAPRMCDLLSFLVEKKICGEERDLTEYGIGLNVFRRDVRVYETVLDPVVRVQVGRLRDRLATYYAGVDTVQDVRISIPVGTYVPVLLCGAPHTSARRSHSLEITPLRNLIGENGGDSFAAGVDEELNAKLFRTFGSQIQIRNRTTASWSGTDGEKRASHRFEGSLRTENHHVRMFVRLVETGSGRIEWVSQFDCHGELGIRLQEQLADAACDRLQCYLAG